MLPGFIPRLQHEILRAISPPPPSTRLPSKPGRTIPPTYDRYSSLRPLTPFFAILNNPNPGEPQSARARANAGKAPAFTPATMPWIGASLAGALKTGGIELAREKWDESRGKGKGGEEDALILDPTDSGLLPDWTRSPLAAGAPIANIQLLAAQAKVGA